MKSFLLVVFLSLGITVSAKADDDDALTADSTADQVSEVLDHQVESIIHKYIDTNDTGRNYNYPLSGLDETDEATALVTKLSIIKSPMILDLLNQTRAYDQLYDPRTFLKRKTLYNVLTKNFMDDNLPDLLASPAPEVLWVVNDHAVWWTNPVLASFLITQLQAMPSEDADDQTPGWIVNEPYNDGFPTPSQTRQWSILKLASLNNNPAVQEQFSDAIQRAIAHDQTRALFFCDALDVVSHSNNPKVLAQAGPLMEHLAGIGQFPYWRVSESVELLVNAHPDLLKDQDFDRDAITFVKVLPYYGLEYDDMVLLARLGDSTAFAAIIENYFNKDYFPYSGGTEDQQQMWKKQFKMWVESNLLSTIVYHGSEDRQQAIKELYHQALFQDGQWILTDPSDTASNENSDNALNSPSPAPSPPPVAQAHPNADKLSAALDKALAAIPNPAAAPPARIAVTARAPMETLDGSGQVTAVTMATVGANYDVVRVEGDSFIVKDASGTQYRIAKQAASAAPAAAASAN